MYKIEITPTTDSPAIEYYERSWFWVVIRLAKISWAICQAYKQPNREIVFVGQEDADNRTQVGWAAAGNYEVFMEIDIEEVPAGSDTAGEPVL